MAKYVQQYEWEEYIAFLQTKETWMGTGIV